MIGSLESETDLVDLTERYDMHGPLGNQNDAEGDGDDNKMPDRYHLLQWKD